ncbi:MAG: PIG-L family deacetylase [Myxococcales bacterium]|nr:PIG-L family deacetylase [Myxococcales bacterium]
MRWSLIVTVLALSCGARSRARGGDIDVLVIAPHPDDEVLMAGGVMAQAVRRGERVAVVLLTNGDLSCQRDGRVRQAETIDALAALGVSEENVRFLGYPDGHLAELSKTPLEVERLGPDGRCGRATTTWATRGKPRTGAAPLLTSTSLTDDLTSVLAELRPREVYVTHGLDLHHDHAMTYVFFRRALDRLDVAPRRVHRSVIHAPGCWPAVDCERPLQPDEPIPPLPNGPVPDERVAIDARSKLSLIGRYRSQLDGPLEKDWLASFARGDEVFFTETYVRAGTRWASRRPDTREKDVVFDEGFAGAPTSRP